MLSSRLSVSDEERAYLASLRPSRIREVQAGRDHDRELAMWRLFRP